MATKAFKYRLYPNKQQKEFLEKNFGCVRFIYNELLALNQKEYKEFEEGIRKDKPSVRRNDLVNRIPLIKKEAGKEFLNDAIAVALQQKAYDLGNAFKKYFSKNAKRPTFKKKYKNQSFRLVGTTFAIKDNKLSLYKCKNSIRINWDKRDLPINPSSVTISKTHSGEYYVCFVCEAYPHRTYGEGVIGIDFGLKDFITTSDGEVVKNPKYYVKHQKKLTRAQRSLSLGKRKVARIVKKHELK